MPRYRLAHRRIVPRARRARTHRPRAALRAVGGAARHRSAASRRARESASTASSTPTPCSRGSFPSGSLEQIIFRVDALHWIEERGITGDQLAARDRAHRSTSSTRRRCCRRPACRRRRPSCARARPTRMAAVLAMGDVVIKPIFGSMGHGIVRVSDPDVAFRVVRSLEQLRAVFYVQRAVDHGGRDVRVFVVGGRVVGAIERQAPDGRLADQRLARRIGAAIRSAAGVGAARAARGGGDRRRLRRRGSAAVTRRRECSCWKSTAFPDGRGCSRRRASTSRRQSSTTGRSRASAATATGALAELRAMSVLARCRRCRGMRSTAADVRRAAQLACLLEVSAPKPGNVSPGRHFADTRYEDFLASAAAIGGPLAGAGTRRSARPSVWRSKRRRAGPARTPISASSCCWRRSPVRRLTGTPSMVRLRERAAQHASRAQATTWTTRATCTRRFAVRRPAGSGTRTRRTSPTSRR